MAVSPSRSYDPKATYIYTLMSLSKSVVPKVATRLDFWLFFLCQLTAWACNQAGYFGTVASDPLLHYLEIKQSHVNNAIWITALIMVFALNQSYLRYLELASLSSKMMGCVYDFCYEARLFLRHDSPYDRLACRWLAVSVLLTFCEAKQNCGGHGVTEEEWRRLVEFNLCRPDEREFLQQLNPKQRLLVMMHTAADLSKQGLEPATAMSGGPELTHRLLECKNLQQQLLDATSAKISFEYFHLLCMLIISSLLFLGYSMALEVSLLAPPTFLIALLTIFGIMELMTVLNEPFADGNEQDFPVNLWAHEFMQNLSALLDYEHGGANDSWKNELKEELRSKTQMHLDLTDINAILYAGSRAMPVARQASRAPDFSYLSYISGTQNARTASAVASKPDQYGSETNQVGQGNEQEPAYFGSYMSLSSATESLIPGGTAAFNNAPSLNELGGSLSARISSLTGVSDSATGPGGGSDSATRPADGNDSATRPAGGSDSATHPQRICS